LFQIWNGFGFGIVHVPSTGYINSPTKDTQQGDIKMSEDKEVNESTIQEPQMEDGLEGGIEAMDRPADLPVDEPSDDGSNAASDAVVGEVAGELAAKASNKSGEGVVNKKLDQEDDDPREDEFPPMSVAAIRELNASKVEWDEFFDPQTGFLPAPAEKDTTVVPCKLTTIQPVFEGTKKDRIHQVKNGIPQYKPTSSLRNFPVGFNNQYVTDVLGGILNDAVTKYLLENLLKPFNKLVMNEHYGRKMPVRSFNAPFKVSLDTIAEVSGVTFEDFLHNLLRTGWFKKSAKVRAFEMEVMCETPEAMEAILSQKGKIIADGKPAKFPLMLGTIATFKRVGKIVAEGMMYKGRPPASAQIFSVLDCIAHYSKNFEDRLDAIEEAEQAVEAGTIPASEITEEVIRIRDGCIEQLGHWSVVTCGLKGMADQLLEAEQKKLKEVSKTGSDTITDSLTSIEGLDDLSFTL